MKTYTHTHTPGPWATADSDWRQITGPNTRAFRSPWNPENVRLVGVARIDGSNEESEDLANARLIAAAPDLLAALKEAREFISTITTYDASKALESTWSAISKAEGRA